LFSVIDGYIIVELTRRDTMRQILRNGLLCSLIFFTGSVYAQDWESSPNNWKNSPNNWENSSSNWKNSPNNWDNSPMRYGNDRIIRDNEGQPKGYVVPKPDGRNYYDLDGAREGYSR
jgi:hypothetical protein